MGDFDGERKDLPNATAALVLGALSLVFCWCYGIIGLVLGILAVVLPRLPVRLIWRTRSDSRKYPIRT